MNTQPKNKILVILIAILLIANIITLSLFLLNRKENVRSGRSDRKAMIARYLEKEVGFTKDQLKQYELISKAQRDNIKPVYEAMSVRREGLIKDVASKGFSDSSIAAAAEAITAEQRQVEVLIFHHLKDIRNICTTQQLPAFDSGFYKIIVKRGTSKKDSIK